MFTFKSMDYLQENLNKITELQPSSQYAAALFIHDLANQGLSVKITEVYRTQERQNELYKIGRIGIPGQKPVTWTRTSLHVQRLACDVLAFNCTYDQVEAVARVYGIYRPKELILLGDIGHYQFDKCIQEPKEPIYSTGALARRLKRIVHDAVEPIKTRILKRLHSIS